MDLDPGTIIFVFLALLIIYYAVSSIVAWNRLRAIPGPFLASFSYLWYSRLAYSGSLFHTALQLRRKYGTLVRVGPNTILVDDPEVLRTISGTKSPYGKDSWYAAGRWNPYKDNVNTIMDPEFHDYYKSRLLPGYSGRETPDMENNVNELLLDLLALIRQTYLSSPGDREPRYMDLSQVASYFTLDVITRVSFSEAAGFLRTNSDLHDTLSTTRKAFKANGIFVEHPWVRGIVFSPFFVKLLGPKPTDDKGLGKMLGIAETTVEKMFASHHNGNRDILGSFIRHGLNRSECEVEAIFMIIAGSETTAATIRSAMLFLMTCPWAYNRLKETIRSSVRDGSASSPISVKEAREIPYLQAIIHETLRLRPPALGLLAKKVPPEGDTIHGQYIPGGTAISVNKVAMMRSTKVFGKDADIFRPERFLEVDEPTRLEMERYVHYVFGHGRWMCAGKPLAFMELNKIFFELLRAFDFQLVDPSNPWKSRSYVGFVDTDMWVRVTKSDMS